MILGQLQPEHSVFRKGEKAVRNVLPPGHPLFHRVDAHQTGAQHHVRPALLNGLDDFGQQCGIVLVIGVHHHDDGGAGAQGLAVAGFLVGAVAVVAVVDEQFEAHFAGDLGGFVGTAIVHQDDQIDHLARQIGVGHVERLGGIVGRHDHHDFGFVGAHTLYSVRARTMNW